MNYWEFICLLGSSSSKGGPYAATGGSSSISANRISYSLGLKGPSVTQSWDGYAENGEMCEKYVQNGVKNCVILERSFQVVKKAWSSNPNMFKMLTNNGKCMEMLETVLRPQWTLPVPLPWWPQIPPRWLGRLVCITTKVSKSLVVSTKQNTVDFYYY